MDYNPNSAAQSKLIDRVLQNADLFDAAGASITASRERIYDHLSAAVDDMLLDKKLPSHHLHSYAIDQRGAANAVLSANTSSLWIPVPSDFLRLLVLDLQTWDEPLYEYDLGDESKDLNRWLVGELSITAKEPQAFMTLWENPDALSWADKSAFRAIPGDDTEATLVTTGSAGDGSDVAVAVEELTSPIGVGHVVSFPTSGATLTVTAAAAIGATSVTGDLDLPIGSGEDGRYFDGISRYQYIPLGVAPESITAHLSDAMTWLATGHAFTGVNPRIARECRNNYAAKLGARAIRRFKGAKRRYRGL